MITDTKHRPRPDNCSDEHLEYLDDLRESGVTNMFGGAAYLQKEFRLTREDAKDILVYWMNTFGQEDR